MFADQKSNLSLLNSYKNLPKIDFKVDLIFEGYIRVGQILKVEITAFYLSGKHEKIRIQVVRAYKRPSVARAFDFIALLRSLRIV